MQAITCLNIATPLVKQQHFSSTQIKPITYLYKPSETSIGDAGVLMSSIPPSHSEAGLYVGHFLKLAREGNHTKVLVTNLPSDHANCPQLVIPIRSISSPHGVFTVAPSQIHFTDGIGHRKGKSTNGTHLQLNPTAATFTPPKTRRLFLGFIPMGYRPALASKSKRNLPEFQTLTPLKATLLDPNAHQVIIFGPTGSNNPGTLNVTSLYQAFNQQA